MKIKNILCLLLCMSILFTITACSNENSSSDVDDTEENNSTTSETIEEEEEPYVQPADITGSILIDTDKSNVLFKSNFKYGVTQTHYRWDNGDFIASKSALDLMKTFTQIGNQHIVSFGASYLQATQDSELDFSSLDLLVGRMENVGGEQMLTLCSAPGWMLVSDPENKYDPESRPKEEYFDEYAAICAEVAKRYPDVKYFQVWNEFKGFWDSELKDINIDLYIKFYNMIYTAVKEARPDALVGGFYGTIRGDYSDQYGYKYDACSFSPANDVAEGNMYWEYLRKWEANAVGCDFVCCDYGVQGYKNLAKLTKDQVFNNTKNYNIALSKMTKETKLPIVMSEYYGQPRRRTESGTNTPEFEGAVMAMIYKNMLLGVQDREYTALFWLEDPDDITCFFTDTDTSDGGQPLPTYYVAYNVSKYFTTGNKIISSTSADESKVEVFASEKKVMVINKTESRQVVQYGDKYYELAAHEVKFLNTK